MKKKTRIYVAPNGSAKVDPSGNPKKNEFVIESDGTTLHVEGLSTGYTPTEAQVVNVKELVADWFNNRYTVFDPRKCKDVKVNAAFSKTEGVPYIDITAAPGKMDENHVNYGTGEFIKWIDVFGTKEAADAAPTPPKEEKPEDKKPKDEKPEDKKDDKSEAAPTPPKEEKKDDKPTPPKDEKPEDKKDDKSEAAPTPPKEEKKDDKPTKRFPELLWDPDKGVDENIRNIMGEP